MTTDAAGVKPATAIPATTKATIVNDGHHEPDDPDEPDRPGRLVLTRDQVRRVDQIAVGRFGVPGVVLMENAARGVVDAIRDERLPSRSVVIFCGGGSNGGDGLAVARLLHNAGAAVTVGLCTDPARYAGDALINWRVVQAMRLPTFPATPEAVRRRLADDRPDLVIDAVFGTGLTARPREPFPAVAEAIERSGIPVVAVDLPSGMDCDTGLPLGDRAIRAKLTVTFVGLKKGFLAAGAGRYTGRVRVAGIGCPTEAVEAAFRGT